MVESTGKGVSNLIKSKELGKVNIEKNPFQSDVEALTAQHFPGSKYLKTNDGNEYILDSNGRTILLFGGSRSYAGEIILA